jgi:hypothetical protein
MLTLNNLHKLRIVYAYHIRAMALWLLTIALAALLGHFAAHGIGRVYGAFVAQDNLAGVERTLTDCLNGGSFADGDGAMVSCENVRTVKVNLVKGL